ncbi:hypothetical protein POM88_048260 [Heracleum sosnowskyi]|uniref:Uncharacterized protein n=1 Tax=Heracleum sosnowskyi TaxID=360622 RepID=A0AAD8GVF2_9APIA|nr:hypothetical protein POM88_048260 [Heracleum sosnowskyi]
MFFLLCIKYVPRPVVVYPHYSSSILSFCLTPIQDKITQISCPVSGCNGSLDPEHCRSVLAPEVFDKWGDELCEALIPAPDKSYSPFIECSALLIKGIKCKKFQKLHKERKQNDVLLMQLAKEKKWTQCPKCKIDVERTEGCLFIRCKSDMISTYIEFSFVNDNVYIYTVLINI